MALDDTTLTTLAGRMLADYDNATAVGWLDEQLSGLGRRLEAGDTIPTGA
ncbi:MAG: hypothetical protein JJ897_00245 [Marinibacterium sp.]|nr:hypothetical protein [Marinibacterium sp.]